jgi:hypothetical protein
MTCVRLDLGSEGLEYLRSRLARGHSFAAFLLQATHLATGSVFTYLPPDVDREGLRSFEVGGLLRSKSQSASAGPPTPLTSRGQDCLIALITDDLKPPGRLCLFEDALARPGDPSVQRLIGDLCFHEGEVYHYVLSGNSEREHVLTTIRRAESLPVFVGAVCAVPDGLQFPPEKRILTSATLHVLASHVTRIVVGAYDGEGYLLWTNP